ncbi:MAG: hypothetical protein HY080_06135 [Gammaproteobacteria bacterium]|nr:hypothetical protein [Gammaproteobacteria bacterium]
MNTLRPVFALHRAMFFKLYSALFLLSILSGCIIPLGGPEIERDCTVPMTLDALNEARSLEQLASLIGPPHGAGYRYDPGNEGFMNRWFSTPEKWFQSMTVKPPTLPHNMERGTQFIIYNFADRGSLAGGVIYVFHTDRGEILGYGISNYLLSKYGFQLSRMEKRNVPKNIMRFKKCRGIPVEN